MLDKKRDTALIGISVLIGTVGALGGYLQYHKKMGATKAAVAGSAGGLLVWLVLSGAMGFWRKA